ncbi:hypothetical protein ADK66_20565 [Micromonospora sp. NRRL B-16802]|uniref:non-ribosomal peptide synthetase n=1 Tax=Micromonospora sp. NRRL B-16802 TaxID=1415541 RepID=UPI0006AE8C74|nr:non-ribosomal peptide synthetase [Micromonospora sp. NRRL B-16802]KOX07140.1 hypothetical protein ADK66_20565 [Micromonospora sp. NRRL B-16802]
MNQVRGFRLSVQQQHIWQLREDGEATWAQTLLLVTGPLDTGRLSAALAEVTNRHAILRTSYRRVPGVRSAVQVVAEPGAAPSEHRFEDLAHLGEAERQERLLAVAEQERGNADVVLASVLFALVPGRHALLLTVSPLSADAETMRLLVAALAGAYRSEKPDEEPVAYAEVVEWQHQAGLDGPVPEADALLAAANEPAATRSLPLQRAGGDRSAGSRRIGQELAGTALHAYARSRGIAPRSVLLAVWQALLARVTAASDVVVGASLGGRGYEELAECLGHFAKWVPIVGHVRPGVSLSTLTTELDRQLTRADDLEENLLASYAAGATGWATAFDCRPEPGPLTAGAVTFVVTWSDVSAEPYGVKLECLLSGDTVRTVWHYRADRFDPGYIRSLAEQYDTLLAGLLADPAAPVSTVTCLDPGTRDELLHSFNDTGRDLPVACLHELVEAQAGRTPDAVAVLDPARTLTYRQLDELADRIAHGLRTDGVGPEDRVGVCLPHSVELVAVILGVLKAGAAYVPLDPAQPWRRIQALVREAQCRIVVTGDPSPAIEQDGTAERRTTEQLAAHGQGKRRRVWPEQLAYVMFTSGSTGSPKGVLVPHRAVVNYLAWAAATYTGGGSGALVHSSIAFDLTVTSLFLPLITGRSADLDDGRRDVLALFRELTTRTGIHLLKLTPSHLAVASRVLAPGDLAGTADCLVLGGEQLTGEAVRPWRRDAPATRVFNEYGPTEAAVGCCVHEVVGEPAAGAVLPIGRPIANTQLYVLDAELEPVAIGVVGEIYLGGRSLARGYLGQPDLTADRFVPDPFSPVRGQRLYRTGDLACHGPDGEVRFLNRDDEQLKIRGSRVEPAEIRAVLHSHPAVADAAVVGGPDGRLTAYLVSADPDSADLDLRAFVTDRLPAFMVPDSFLWIDSIPLTANGKLDRGRLTGRPTPARKPISVPTDAVELTVVRLIEELLDRAPVGMDEDFFELGGHSLLAVRLIARINAACHTDLPVAVFFDQSAERPATAAHLARAVRSGGMTGEQPMVMLRDGTGTPLFCVHPAGGDIVGFRDLSLSGVLRRPLYGMQAPPPEQQADQSVDFLAGHYLSALRETQPTGPYLLMGWSMGGLVAYELARRLTAAGEQVAMLAMVETYPGEVLPDDVSGEAARHLAGELGRLPLNLDELGVLLPGDEATEQVLATASTAGLVSSDREHADLERRVRLNHLHVRAAAGYRPGPYAGPVTLVQASHTTPELRRDALAVWRRICTGPVVVHELPGEHFTLLRRPAVDDLAKILESAA